MYDKLLSKMLQFLLMGFVLTTQLIVANGHESLGSEFQTVDIEGRYSVNRTVTVHANIEYVIRFPDSTSKYPYLVYASSKHAYFDHPVFIVVRQQRQVTSWELPLPVESKSGTLKFPYTSRTLCHNSMEIITQMPRSITYSHSDGNVYLHQLHKQLSLSVSTVSKIPTPVTIRVEEPDDFYVEDDKDYSVTISPSDPRFFYYKFQETDTNDYSNTVILEVTSEDEVCLTVSIQNASCPVFDLEQDIAYQGKYQTVQTKGGIIIKQKYYPNGFFVVLVAKGDNYDCSRNRSAIPMSKSHIIRPLNRSSVVVFNIKPGISKAEYYIASLSTLGVILIFYIVVSICIWGFYRWGNLRTARKVEAVEGISLRNRTGGTPTETDDGFTNAADDIDKSLASTNLMLTDLAKKNPEYFEKKSLAYLWHVISIAIFYGIPVVQLVVTYQRVVNVSGNQDICYYNFLCAHPLFGFSDYNHIFSNVGYIFVGILFLLVTFYRHNFIVHSDRYGIPKHYGLFYAMGVSLIMEGVLSACYHICPNQSNFQFDTSFMYVMAVLCLVKLYQNRHPDINATAYATFVVLGFAIFAVMIGVLHGHILVWILFIIFYTALCFYLSFNIYFLSYVKRGFQGIVNEWNEDHSVLKVIEPKRKAHFGLLLVANTLNVILACLGILCYYMGTDFATFLLGILMANAVLYAAVYIIMKLIHHERICLQAILFGILGLTTWIGATYFFINNSTLWTVTAAESRQWNTHCLLMNFYDHHDIWHLLSASALFFTFMMLLSLDDDLVNIPHASIAVF